MARTRDIVRPAGCPQCLGTRIVGHGERPVQRLVVTADRVLREMALIVRFRCRNCLHVIEADRDFDDGHDAAREFVARMTFLRGAPSAAEAAGIHVQTVATWISEWQDRTGYPPARTSASLGIVTFRNPKAVLLFGVETGELIAVVPDDPTEIARAVEGVAAVAPRIVRQVGIGFSHEVRQAVQRYLPDAEIYVPPRFSEPLLHDRAEKLPSSGYPAANALRDDVAGNGWSERAVRSFHEVSRAVGGGRADVALSMWKKEIVAGYASQRPADGWKNFGVDPSGLTLLQFRIAVVHVISKSRPGQLGSLMRALDRRRAVVAGNPGTAEGLRSGQGRGPSAVPGDSSG